MESKPLNFEVKVGIFVFLGILIMFAIVFSIGQLYILKPMYIVRIVFNFANGIEIGAPVRLAGVNVGEVNDISVYYDNKLQMTKVMISARIKNEAKVEKNAVCRINTLGLLGEKYLEVTPGTADAGFLANSEVIAGKDPVQMEEVTKNMKDLSDTVKSATEVARSILEKVNRGEGTIGKLMTDDKVYNDLKDVLDRIDRGQGTVGKLLTEEKIYNDLEAFVDDIKRHPWKLLIKERERPEGKRAEGRERAARTDFK